MKNPCWKGYEAYGMKNKNGKEVPNCVPIKEHLQQLTKDNIIFNLIENKDKAQFAKREGNQSQRPKQFGKGGKAGTEKTQERRRGKQQAQDMYEGVNDFFDTDESGATRGLGRNYGVEHEPDVTPASEMTHIHHFEYVDSKDQNKGLQYRKDSRLARHGIPVEMIDTATLLPKAEHQAAFAQHPNALAYLKDAKNYHWDSYEWNRAMRSKGLKGAGANAAYHTRLGIATKSLIERIKSGQSTQLSENIYTKLKNSLAENKNWNPPEENEFGAAADDMMLQADDEANLQASPLTHQDMIKVIQDAHEAAASHAYTAATMGKKSLSPEEMKALYHQHFDNTFSKLFKS